MGFLHEEHDPPHGDTDEGYWQVHLAVDPPEKEAVQRIGPTVVPGEHLDLHTELIDGRDSDVVLTMKVFAKTRDDARDRAGYLFRKIRETAGLSQAPTTILGHISPWWKTSYGRTAGNRVFRRYMARGRGGRWTAPATMRIGGSILVSLGRCADDRNWRLAGRD